MANKRNYEWPQASAWDGYFTQDKPGGTTQRVDPSLVFDRLRDEGFINEESLNETIEHVLDLTTLDEENSTFNVVLTANHNNAISFVGSSEQTAIVAIEIEGAKSYHVQIVGACTLAITGVEWWGDVITDITNKSEINIMNGRAIGVLIDV